MESIEELKNFWEESKRREPPLSPPDAESVERIIKGRVRREKKLMMEYFWASFVYQIMLYSFAGYLIVKYRGDREIMLGSLSVAMLYVPFTVILMRKFKAICLPAINRSNSSGQSIRANVENKHTLLSEFFRFKKVFDWVGIPLVSLVLVSILFKLYVAGGIAEHLTGGILSFAAVMIVFITATYLENRKHFINPLRQLKSVLTDLEQAS